MPAERLERRTRRTGGAPAETPLVLVESAGNAMRLAAVSRSAQASGLTPGLTLADARARVPGLDAVDHDRAADEAFLLAIAEDAARWTPLVAVDPPHGLALDITGCAHLFGGEGGLLAKVPARLARTGLTVRAAIAGTPETARALARFGPGGIVPPGGDAEVVLSLPVAALEAGDETLVALRRAGFRLIGDLAGQPTAPLVARFGEAIVVRLRRMLGREDRRITPLRPAPVCMVEQPFAEPIARAEDVEHSLRRLAGRAALVLEARGQGGRIFEAIFFRADGQVRRIGVATGRPSRDPDAILRLFREKLDALADPLDPGFGFDLIRLAVPHVQDLAATQPGFDRQAKEDDEVADLVDRLVARFGQARVLKFVAADTHDPLRAAALIPATASFKGAGWLGSEAGEPPCRPLRLFDPPQAIETLAEVPDGPPVRFRWRRVLHEVARAEGPERIAAEWWRDRIGPTRDYYRVEDAAGHRFWLFREGLFHQEGPVPRWYLHGLFA